MVKSLMDFFDVVFPLNMSPLTYYWPSSRGKILPGMLVSAEIKKNAQLGIVLRRTSKQPTGTIKELIEIVFDKPVISEALISLLKWMAEYYLVPEGVVLKSMFPTEHFAMREKQRPAKKEFADVIHSERLVLPAVSPDTVSSLGSSLSENEYKTFLLNAPSFSHEIAYALAVMKGRNNIIILVPEITDIEKVSPFLGDFFGDRLIILHGKLSGEQRRKAIHRILSGHSDIILGTRLAVFAPLKSISFIAVLQEHNRSYKNLEGVRYHARDVAVMRGYLEKTNVILSSPTPSMESFLNTIKGKYILLAPPEPIRRPRVEIINMRTAKSVTPYLSRRAIQAASLCMKESEKALFFINRRGFSLIQCAECNDIQTCPACGIPLIYHKNKGILACHYCGRTLPPSNSCPMCKGTRLDMVGAGTQRIAAEIKKHLHIEPLRFDKDSIRDEPKLKSLADVAGSGNIVVGTKAIAGRLAKGEAYKLCVFLNPDMGLHLPDFRSAEFLFQEIFSISEYIRHDGLIIIQTKMPENDVFMHVKKYRFMDFSKEELLRRESLSYPPFSRMIIITVSSKNDAGKTLMDALPPEDDKITLIGPLDLSKRGTHAYKVILKSPAKERLRLYAKNFLLHLKREKGIRAVADVDPISL